MGDIACTLLDNRSADIVEKCRGDDKEDRVWGREKYGERRRRSEVGFEKRRDTNGFRDYEGKGGN